MNVSSARPSALQPLRTATHALHEFLDSHLPVGRENATLQDYLGHLSTLRPWLIDLRAALQSAGVPALDSVAHRIDARLAAIDLDLKDGGATPAVSSPPATGVFIADAPTSGYAWGLAYVFEGSQLGGAVMHKRLHQRLAPHPMRYFQPAEGESIAAGWQAFMAGIAAHVEEGAQTDAAQRGAVAAFETLIARFGLRPTA